MKYKLDRLLRCLFTSSGPSRSLRAETASDSVLEAGLEPAFEAGFEPPCLDLGAAIPPRILATREGSLGLKSANCLLVKLLRSRSCRRCSSMEVKGASFSFSLTIFAVIDYILCVYVFMYEKTCIIETLCILCYTKWPAANMISYKFLFIWIIGGFGD